MPIYEYQCTACAHQLEVLQKMTEAPLTQCPHCHQATLSKLVSAAGFQLKGTGWYATDYSSKNRVKSDSNSERGATSTSSTTETKTTESKESTPAASSSGGDKSSTGPS